MTDVPLGLAAANLPSVVERARQADQVLTVDGRAEAVVVDARQYASMRETLRVMSDPDLMHDLETGLTETARFTSGDIAQLLLQRCSSVLAGPRNEDNLRSCQQLIDTLDGHPSMPTAVLVPMKGRAPVIPFPSPRPSPDVVVEKAVNGAVAAMAAAPSPWAAFREVATAATVAVASAAMPRDEDLDTMWNMRRPDPVSDSDWAQEAHSGELRGFVRRGVPSVERPSEENVTFADRRSSLFRALLTATGMRRKLREPERDGE